MLYIFWQLFCPIERKKTWPGYRIISWSFGILCAMLSLVGPIADLSHTDFSAHMIGHVLLGMLAPLLMALGTPVTLLLRRLLVSHSKETN